MKSSSPEARHTLSIILENEAGALCRVAGLFAARGYNIESLTVAPTHDRSLSRMTLVTRGSPEVIEQIIKQVNKLVDVAEVQDLTAGEHVERELVLVKVRAQGEAREELKRLSDIFRGRIIDVTQHIFTIEVTGSVEKAEAFLAALPKPWILEVVRTGACGISRGEETTDEREKNESLL